MEYTHGHLIIIVFKGYRFGQKEDNEDGCVPHIWLDAPTHNDPKYCRA